MSEQKRRGNRFWRYAPVIIWMAVIFLASTDEFSGANTSRIVRPLLLWLFPKISEEKINIAHLVVRKTAHLTEYAVFALFVARAFATSSHVTIRRWFFDFTLIFVVVFSLSDETHQSFVASRTGSIYDSFIDISGGLVALIAYAFWRRRSWGHGAGADGTATKVS